MGAEVCKNIILGGVKSVTLMDPATVTPVDAACQFLVGRDAVGKNVRISSNHSTCLFFAFRLNDHLISLMTH